jgi:aspartate racemase
MQTIGVLGGMTWHSTAEYYRLLNELGAARVLITSVDAEEVEPLMAAGRWHEAGEQLARDAAALEHAGAEVFVLACNSMHNAWETIVAPLSIPSIHIGEATADALAGTRSAALLGTRYTMEGTFLRAPLEARGIDVVIPEADDRAEVHRAIFEELSHGEVRDETVAWFSALVDRLDAEAVVLACGELGLLGLEGRIVDTVRAHAAAAVAYAA